MSTLSPVGAPEIAPLELKIPGLPITLNQWMRNWKMRRELNEKAYWLVWQAFGNARHRQVYLHGPWFPGRVRVEVDFYVPGNNRVDTDNLVPKSILDALRRNHVIRDDNIDIVKPLVLEGHRIPPGQKSYTVIRVSDARDRS